MRGSITAKKQDPLEEAEGSEIATAYTQHPAMFEQRSQRALTEMAVTTASERVHHVTL